MPTGVMVVLGIILASVAFAVFLIARSVAVARDNLKVSAAQQRLPIKRWYKVNSRRRRDRVRSQLPVPEQDEPTSDEAYLWVTGLAPARLWFLWLPSLLALPVVVSLWLWATELYQHPYDFSPTGAQDFEPLHLNRLGAFGLNLAAWVLLLVAAGRAVTVFLKWSGEFLVLSTYRVIHLQIHPAWVYWMRNKGDKIELSDITHAGVWRSALLADAFRYATITLDTPGRGDDQAFSMVRFIPNGVLRANEIEALQKFAIAPAQRSETDRIIGALREGNRLPAELPLATPELPDAPTSALTPEIHHEQDGELPSEEDETEASN